jgi:hypothetical protein
MSRIVGLLAVLLITGPFASAHPGHEHSPDLRVWKDADGLFEIEGSFVLAQDGRVQLCKHDGTVVWVPLAKLSPADRAWVRDRTEAIRRLNGVNSDADFVTPIEENPSNTGATETSPVLAAVTVFALVFLAATGNFLRRRSMTLTALAAAFGMGSLGLMATAQDEKKPAIQKHFEPFKDKVKYRSDGDYFYVESNGFPDHPMMIGITAWQQQVPLPQPYTGKNAWRIPLQPKLADKPVSAKSALFRGAIALAANGVPIFNPIKNDGKTDTYLAGELDEYGGHCGRGDDYHYHIAPIHLERVVGKGNPIGYALDGFPLYGLTDADGKEPKDLDEFNGRIEKDGYRYYSTKKYPYVNGGLRGVVTVKDDQIDPQPRANPVRPDGRPLRGAKITGFTRDDEKKTYTVVYELAGKALSVKYTINGDGTYGFVFTDGSGKETTETYRNRPQKDDPSPKKKDGPPPKKDDTPPKKDGDTPPKKDDGPRLPWLAAHFDELDTDGDGFLTLEELKKEVEKTFTAYDANKDGKLTKDEYAGKGPNVKSALAGFVKGHAAEFADKDGVITKQAFESFMTAMFEKADRKKAGKITKAEASQTGPKKPE